MKKTKPSSSWIIKKGKTHVKYNKPPNFNNRYGSEIRKRMTTTDGNRVPLIYRFLNKKKSPVTGIILQKQNGNIKINIMHQKKVQRQ